MLKNPSPSFSQLLLGTERLIESLLPFSRAFQPVLIGEMLQPSDHLHGPCLDPLQQVHVSPVLRIQRRMQHCRWGPTRAEGRGRIPPSKCCPPCFDAAQEIIGFLGSKPALLSHVLCLIHSQSQALLSRVALYVPIPQLVLITGSTLTQVQDLGLVEHHKIAMCHFSSLSRSLWMASHPSVMSTTPLNSNSYFFLLLLIQIV